MIDVLSRIALVAATAWLVILGPPVMAQTGVEQFDVSGIPTPPTTFTEQRLLQMVSRHRAGDTTQAIQIQRALAEYYAKKGDTRRAQAASSRASAGSAVSSPSPRAGDVPVAKSGDVPMRRNDGVPVPRPGDVAMRQYGDVPTAKSGDVPMRSYGDVPMRKYGDVGVGKPGDVAVPRPGDVAVPTPGDAPAPSSRDVSPPDAPAALPPTAPSGPLPFTGSFSRLLSGGRTVETWTFKPNGAYRYQLGTPGVASHSEEGTFRVMGDVLELNQTDEATAASSGAGPYGRLDTAGARARSRVRQLKFQISGTGNRQHLILDGKDYFRALD